MLSPITGAGNVLLIRESSVRVLPHRHIGRKWVRKSMLPLILTRFFERTVLHLKNCEARACVRTCDTGCKKEQPAALFISSLIYQIPLPHYQQDHYPLSCLPRLPRFYWDSRWHTKISAHTSLLTPECLLFCSPFFFFFYVNHETKNS